MSHLGNNLDGWKEEDGEQKEEGSRGEWKGKGIGEVGRVKEFTSGGRIVESRVISHLLAISDYRTR